MMYLIVSYSACYVIHHRVMVMNPYHIFKYVPLSVLQILARFVAWIIVKIPSLSIMRTINTNMALITPALSDCQKNKR